MKQIIITGGAGFIGSSLAIAVKEHFESVNVTVFDNLLRRGSELNLKRLEKYSIEYIPGVSENGISEDFLIMGYRSFYGASKLAGEIIRMFWSICKT